MRTKFFTTLLFASALFLGSFAMVGAVSTFITQQGGTGTTSPSGILYGDNGATSHLNTVTIGSNLTFTGGTLSATGGGGSGTVGTSTNETQGFLPYWTTTSGTPALLGKVATGTETCSTGASCTSFTVVGSGGAITVSGLTTSNFSSANISQWTNNSNYITLASLSATTPILYNNSTGAFTWVGLATTSQPSSSNVITSNGTSGVYGTATSTLTATSPLTGSFTQLGSGGALGCQIASQAQAGCESAANFALFNNKIGTSSTLTVSQLLYVTGTGSSAAPTVAVVATSSLGVTGPITFSGTIGAQVGGAGGNFACTTAASGVAGCLSNTAFDTFNNKQAALTFTYPLVNTANTITTAFGTTTNTGIAKNMILSTDNSGIVQATSTPTAAAYLATSTTATSTFAGNLMIGTAANSGQLLPNDPFQVSGSNANGLQFVFWNTSSANTAYTCLELNNDKATNSSYYSEFCEDSSAFNGSTAENPGDTTLLSSDGGMVFELASSTFPQADYRWTIGGVASSSIKMVLKNNGRLGVGTTTPNFGVLTVSSSTEPQVALSDALGSVLWTERNINGNLYIATSTFSATSSNAILSIIPNAATNATTTFAFTDLALKQTSQLAFSVLDQYGTSALTINTASTTGPLLAVFATTTKATSCGGSGITCLFSIDQYGHLSASSTVPVLSSCGTSPSLTPDSSDLSGTITVGSVSATACTLTFGVAHTIGTHCTITNQSMSITNAGTYSESLTGFTFSQTALTSDKLDYICTGQ